MDSKLVNEQAVIFQDRTIRLTPELFKQLGFVKKNIHLKIEEFIVSAVPFDLSLAKASLLSFLTPKEVDFFQKFAKTPQKLALCYSVPYSPKPISYFVHARLAAFRKVDPASPYCFIDLELINPPLALKELVVGHFMELDSAERFFNEAGDDPLSSEMITEALGSARLTLIKEDAVAERLKILRLSPRKLRAFGEFEGIPPAMGEKVELEPWEGDSACLILGTVTEFAPLADAEGFAYISVDLAFSSAAFSRIRAVAERKLKR
ncbi:MAG TPA: hypothetical protein DIC34_11780 [Treponema sp.]|nr:MAG: hypothetical protein A2001_13365 [Treponema sp. GWC1_61_84]OHE75344.1 MAG: hypothetical protein A2413_07985 [Treponema sp. RIFOXYC1_FULL_61_9]HCM27205.1 hypothetical protein [Treponema sp.]